MIQGVSEYDNDEQESRRADGMVAIESYKEGLDPIKAMFGREKELPVFIRKLRTQHDHYEQTIQLLFGSITSDAEFAKMTADPGSSQELWKRGVAGDAWSAPDVPAGTGRSLVDRRCCIT
jgi:hypothetical protein